MRQSQWQGAKETVKCDRNHKKKKKQKKSRQQVYRHSVLQGHSNSQLQTDKCDIHLVLHNCRQFVYNDTPEMKGLLDKIVLKDTQSIIVK